MRWAVVFKPSVLNTAIAIYSLLVGSIWQAIMHVKTSIDTQSRPNKLHRSKNQLCAQLWKAAGKIDS
jgi:uncharacterized membrane protein YciS (DUF1049 family)